MPAPPLSSSAWLATYYRTAKASHAFAVLSSDLKARTPADLVAVDYPDRADEIREWDAATREAVLNELEELPTSRVVRREGIA